MTSARLLRYASYLSGFNYTLKFKKGNENKNVDCLSRAPLKNFKSSADIAIGNEVHAICAQSILQISSPEITAETIKLETKKDSGLSKIKSDLLKTSNDSEFTLVNGIIFRGERIYIPSSLRTKVLEELHETHLGITKMKQLARRYVYWPNIDKEIEHIVKGCRNCALTRSNPPTAPVHPWDPPQENWDRVHIDYAGPFQGFNFLLCIDARSKWAEVKVLKDAPSSSNTELLLEQIFAVHGYPRVLVSDNATIFQSDSFHTYCSTRGIFQKFTAPGHPATNGLAERSVQTLKNRLKTASTDKIPMLEKVQRILMRYRATPLACGQSPAELYLHRKLRIRLDAIFPHQPQVSVINTPPTRSFNEGERVQVRMFVNNKYEWQFGEIKRKLGTRHYIVSLDSSERQLKRHINQLRSTLVPKPKSVTFGPSKSFNIPIARKSVSEVPQTDTQHTANRPTPLMGNQMLPEPQLHQRPQRQRRLPNKFSDYVLY